MSCWHICFMFVQICSCNVFTDKDLFAQECMFPAHSLQDIYQTLKFIVHI